MSENYNLGKAVFARFVRGFIAGAAASAATITFYATNLHELQTLLAMLVISLIVGGLAGGILALDKFFRSTPVD